MKKIYTINNVLNDEECREFIEKIKSKKEVVNFNDSGKFKNDKYIKPDLAQKLFDTIPKEIIKQNGLLRPNKLVMTGMYEPGDNFGLHTDTGLYYNLKTREKSNFTYLVYLNDDFEGGETCFYTTNFRLYKTIQPEKGKGLLFDLNYWHKANEIKRGFKYWIGIEVITKF